MKKPPIRFYIGIMIFLTTFTNYMLRVNVNVSVIDMVDRKSSNFTPSCLRGTNVTMSKTKTVKITTFERYDWNEKEVGTVLGAYFYGYLVTVMPGGMLAEYIGPWHVILWSSIATGILNGFTPMSAQLGYLGVAANRFLMGLFGGVVYPAVNTLIAKWAPPKEKGKFLAAMMGNTLGTVVTFNLVGWATASYGWPWGYYSLVIIQAVYCVLFAFIVSDSPETHRWISEEEKNFIASSQEGHISTKKKIAPFRQILKSIPFWVCAFTQFGNLWGLNLIISYTPKFMAETIGFNIKTSAVLAAAPPIARLLVSNLFGAAGDYIRRKELMTLTHNRKFFILFSHFIPAICLCLIQTAKCNYIPVVILMILNQAFNGAVVVSNLINPQDLSPNFAGTIFGMMNLIGMSTGIFVPMITGALNDYYNMELMAATWITSIGGGMLIFSGLLFILLGSAEVQPWNNIKEQETIEM